MSDDAIVRVRQVCLAFPETNERLSHGAPTFLLRDRKAFVMFMDNHHDDGRLAIWCHAPHGMQGALIEREPERFFVPPYVGHRGWVGVRLERGVDWDQVAEMIEDAYRMVAPKPLIAQLVSREEMSHP